MERRFELYYGVAMSAYICHYDAKILTSLVVMLGSLMVCFAIKR